MLLEFLALLFKLLLFVCKLLFELRNVSLFLLNLELLTMKFVLFMFSFLSVDTQSLSFICEFSNHLVLLLFGLGSDLFELSGFLNDSFLSLGELIVDLSFLSLLLEESDSLQGSLRHDNNGSTFVEVTIGEFVLVISELLGH